MSSDHLALPTERQARRLRLAAFRAVRAAGRPDSSRGSDRLIRGVGLPLLLGVGAAAAKALIDAVSGGDLGYLGFVAAVVVAAWIGGLTGGIVATATSALFQATLFLEPSAAQATGAASEPLQLGLFLADGLLISAITAGLRIASFREHAARQRNETLLRRRACGR